LLAPPLQPSPLLATGKVFSNATLGLVGNADINVANSTYPYLTAYIKSVNPKKPKPGATVKVTIGVRNDGTADGKVRPRAGLTAVGTLSQRGQRDPRSEPGPRKY
jgi:hypothetical protein